MSWTDERVEVLKKLWIDGLSASQIAKQLGSVTRNAVIGKVHRLGLAGRAAPARPMKRITRVRPILVAANSSQNQPIIETIEPIAEKANLLRPSTSTLPQNPAPVAVKAIKRDTSGGIIGVLDLVPNMCKWPIGDPTDADFGFCGARSHESWPYCEEHGALAYQPHISKKNAQIKTA